MTIQHKDIPDAQLHEPKGVATASTKTVYHADGLGSGSWRKTTEDDIDFSDKTKNKFGWNDVASNQYTSGAPLAITASTRTQLPNNAAASQTDQSRLGTIWNTGSNQFLISDLNAFYIIRVNMKITAAAAAGTPYVALLELQSDNGPTVITGNTQFIKGGGYVNQVAWNIPFYNGTFINNQPLKLFITPDTNINLYDIGFVIQRTYREV